jgi:hypothetical protein
MNDQPRHCPFLNRDDARCAKQFTVGHMEHAFRHCFGSYKACPTYLELLVERRIRRMSESVVHAKALVQVSVSARHDHPRAAHSRAA